jgi:transposase
VGLTQNARRPRADAETNGGVQCLSGHIAPQMGLLVRCPRILRHLERVAKPEGGDRCFGIMSEPLVPDDLWDAIEPLLPKEPPKPRGGRPRVPDRAALGGIVFVLRTGCPWRLLPKELGCGSGATCWRRLRDWQVAGVWERLHARVLNWLGDEAAIDWSRASLDSLSVRAKRGASRAGRTRPTVARPVPSTTWSSIEAVSLSLSAFRLPTPTTQLRWCR